MTGDFEWIFLHTQAQPSVFRDTRKLDTTGSRKKNATTKMGIVALECRMIRQGSETWRRPTDRVLNQDVWQ